MTQALWSWGFPTLPPPHGQSCKPKVHALQVLVRYCRAHSVQVPELGRPALKPPRLTQTSSCSRCKGHNLWSCLRGPPG
ncbi:hypothetical protein FWK35_00036979 [Aphis craccivora]|uniref:Uncharacterized protein n=1 Tax=Aphis craccivora TaxID=307492 RepID=A0A6G0VTZ5_APHCR|nr:hypothetical protein FWK35_00036979 [Aphis craccivora]